MIDRTINIRSIQHFMYCPRRYGLLEVNNDWQENAFVVKANILHENVHEGKHSFSDRKRVVRSSVTLYNDLPQYDLYGIADCVEFLRDDSGTEITGLDGRFKVQLVEYKPRLPKSGEYNETDAIQVFAQKLCADFIWSGNCRCFIYYCDAKKRVPLPFDTEFEQYDERLKELLAGMRRVLSEGRIPPREKGQKCSGCSMADLCFPKSAGYSVREEIGKIREAGWL